ncbi:MAG: hypothetical protein WBI12_10890 [Methanosarcina flavescens]|uniref:Uncharacterized protein n=1 Tax=Methanosarcina flavescens TaxID=1715806 RepID=A0A660HRP5_9EURY|nr:hypothetical protein AOB57_005625 [Methanosarcina flavescens]NLK33557.1 hypothetical protein [Methanosarcina flavescens]
MYQPYFSPELQAQAFLKKLDRKSFQKKFDHKPFQKRLERNLLRKGFIANFLEKSLIKNRRGRRGQAAQRLEINRRSGLRKPFQHSLDQKLEFTS